MELSPETSHTDPWTALGKFTPARIALGRAGVSIPYKETLSFKLAHAFARDAVFAKMDKELLVDGVKDLQHPLLILHSKAANRGQFLQRPDMGRRLDENSISAIQVYTGPYDVCINIADGLSANAINHHVIPVLRILVPALISSGMTVAPICIIEEGRVAISDETGQMLNSKLSIILIGERPGLSSPDSLGVYLTYHPEVGNTDANRNCISNIGPNGLSYQAAADKILYLIKESIRLKLSGVLLKDSSGTLKDMQIK